MAGIFPTQKRLESAKDFLWYRDCGNYIRDEFYMHTAEDADLIDWYKAAAGIIDERTYKHVVNPFNSEKEEFKSFPAKLRNYDIIIPIISLFLGEKAERNFQPMAIVANPDVNSKNEQGKKSAAMKTLAQMFINELNASGVNTGVPSKDVKSIPEVIKQYEVVNEKDAKAINAQKALDYLLYELSLKDKFLEAFYDWIVSGQVYSYKDMYKNDVIHEFVPPLEIKASPTRTGFIEDSDMVRRYTRYTLSQLNDRFHETDIFDREGKKVDLLEYLESKYATDQGTTNNIRSGVGTNLDSERDTNWKSSDSNNIVYKGLIDCCHTQWKGYCKVGILKYRDEFGMLQEMEVDEDYKFTPENGDIDITWEWLGKAYEIYIIDEDLYAYPRPIQVQRNELSNSSVVKLSYNGKKGYNYRDQHNSIVKQLLPYSRLINTLKWRMELMIAKNKEKILTLPLGLIPDGRGWDHDKVFYFAEAMNILVLDETKPNAIAALNALKSIDLSMGKYISEINGLIVSTKNEAWDSIGMNRQRYGDVNSSDGKGTNEQAIIRSSVISRKINREYERFEESDCQGLIDISRVAWIDGKKGPFVTDEGMTAFLDLNGEDHANTDIGIFITDSMQAHQDLKMAKDYAFGAAQKGGVPTSLVMETIDAKSLSKIKSIAYRAEELTKQYEAEVAQNEEKAKQALQQMQMEAVDKTNQVKIEAEKIKADASIQVALINKTGDEGDDTDASLDHAHDSYQDELRKSFSDKQKVGAAYADKISENRLKEANFKLDQEKLAIAKKKASNTSK